MAGSLTVKMVFSLLGAVAGMAGTLFVLARDNAYLKGKIDEVLRRLDLFQKVAEHVAVLDKALFKTGIDITHAHDKIRKLEREGVNGSGENCGNG